MTVTVLMRDDAPVHATPNATMATLASPSRGGSAIAVWEVVMSVDAAGPAHIASADQVYVVRSGRGMFAIDGQTAVAEPGDTVVLLASTTRQVVCAGPEPLVALVVMAAGARITMPDGTDRGTLDWAR